MLVCSATADSASCHNFLFSEDKIANGYSDDNAKGHKSQIFQELKLCLQKEQGRTIEERSILSKNSGLDIFMPHMLPWYEKLIWQKIKLVGWSV